MQSPGSSTKSTPDNLTTGRGRRSSDRETLNTDTPFGDNGMDVSMDSGSRRSSKQGASPFDAGTSPVGTSMSAISSGRKSSRGRPSYGDDDVDDDYGGYGDYDDDYGEVSALSSKSGGSSRRVSFGRDTKDVSTESGNKIGSSRRSSFESPGNRSRASDSTPGSVRSNRSGISTPGSDDFARGTQAVDETYMESEEEEAVIVVGKGKKNTKKGKKSTAAAVDDSGMVDTDGEDIDTSGFADDSFASKLAKKGTKRGKMYVDDAFGSYEEENEDDAMDLDEDSDEGVGVRRSRRATKERKWPGGKVNELSTTREIWSAFSQLFLLLPTRGRALVHAKCRKRTRKA